MRRKRWLAKFALAVLSLISVRTFIRLSALDEIVGEQASASRDDADFSDQGDTDARGPWRKLEGLHVQGHSLVGDDFLYDGVFDDERRRYKCSNARPGEDEVKYMNGYWQKYKNGSDEVLVISAFYDDRPLGGLLPNVRVQAVARPSKSPLYCYLWYPGHAEPYVTEAVVNSSGRGDTIDRVKYGQYQYSCPLLKSLPIPSHVSLTTSLCHNTTIYLPIKVSSRSGWKFEFGVCVAIAFGSVPSDLFVEWMELNQLLGVAEVHIYDGNISPSMESVFDHYRKKDVLYVHAMPPPVADFTSRGVKLSSPASINDCMLRYMYRYRYIVVVDFDEVIVPRMDMNYSALLQRVDRDGNLASSHQSYTFRNAYFFQNFSEDSTQPKHLRTLRMRHRAKPSAHLFAPKSFLDPKRCFLAFNHYCYVRFPGSVKNPFTVDVKTEYALSHHYRKCNRDCPKYDKEKELDDVMLKFKDDLIKRVNAVSREFNVTLA